MTQVSNRESILVVDDAAATVEVLQRNLSSKGYRVFTASSTSEATKVLEASPVDLVITDLKMPGPSGLDLVRHVRQNHADTEVMMITGYATVEGAVEAVKSGAEEYLSKPFTDDELFSAVTLALEKLQVRRAARHKSVVVPEAPLGIIGESEAIKEVFTTVAKAARTAATVLVTGESGTGKELIARAIHYGGSRAASSFVTVNCGGIPESLLESELFGHVKGAFTGAVETRAGFFQTADGGTIFLDEVSEMSLGMQVKLLRALQEKEVYMVGSTRPHQVDVRVLAASNKNLVALVEKEAFREDLYYRLNVIPINLPPLRDRGDDILLLIRHFSAMFAAQAERPVPSFTGAALSVLRAYHWPGNVRELQNVIHRLVVMVDGDEIDVPDLPDLMRVTVPRQGSFTRTLADVEAEYIRNVVESVDGNKTRAAEILGIDRKTLREKLKKHTGETG
jgi:two-component system, NtrC family, response regulator HydG